MVSFPLNIGRFIFRSLRSEAIFFAVCQYVSLFFSLLSGIIIRRLLGPLLIGLFSELMIILQYGKLHHLGVMNALERDIPFYRGRNDDSKVALLQKAGLAFILLTTFHAMVIIGALVFFLKDLQGKIPFVILLVFIETLIAYYQTLLQSYKKFKNWGIITAVMGGIDFILKWSFTFFFGIYGLLSAMCVSGCLTFIFYLKWSQSPFPFSLAFSWKEIKELLGMGIHLIFFRAMYLFSQSADRLIVLLCLGRLQLGLYSISAMLNSYLTMLPKFSFRTLSPTIIETFGRTRDIESMQKFLITPHQKFGMYFAVLIGLIILGLPFGIHWILPQFESAVWSAQIISLAAFFGSFIYTSNMILMALNEQKKMAFLYGAGAGISIITILFFVFILHQALIGVACGMVLGQFVFTTILISYVYQYYTKNIFEHIKLFIKLYYPVIWIIFALSLSLNGYSPSPLFIQDGVHFAIMAVIFLICCSPLFYFLHEPIFPEKSIFMARDSEG